MGSKTVSVRKALEKQRPRKRLRLHERDLHSLETALGDCKLNDKTETGIDNPGIVKAEDCEDWDML